MSLIATNTWLCIGGAVERELDDVSNIWAAASIVKVHSAEGHADLVYDDGSQEDRVPVDELRAKPQRTSALSPQKAMLPEPAMPATTSDCDEEEYSSEHDLALVANGGSTSSYHGPPARGLTATLRNLRCQAKRLTESVATIRQGQHTKLARLAAATLDVAQGTKSLRSSRRSLAELAHRLGHSARHIPRTPSSAKAISRGFDDVRALCEASTAYEALADSPSRSLRREASRTGTPTARPPLAPAASVCETPKHRTSRRARSSAAGSLASGSRGHASAMMMDLKEEVAERVAPRSPFTSTDNLQKSSSPGCRVRASSSLGALRASKAHPAPLSSKTRQHPLDWSMGPSRQKFGGAF